MYHNILTLPLCWTPGLYGTSEQRCSESEIQRLRKSVLLWSPRGDMEGKRKMCSVKLPDGNWMLGGLRLLPRTQHLGPRE